ncbi:hypothetical protein P4133_03220 [Pseudomonas aeruginosa]|nr:hypothetical protein [Pseudomonas aeruginosa]
MPLAGAAALLALRLIPADARRQRGRRFDLAGALTVTAGATLLVFALVQGPESGWDAPSVRFGLYLPSRSYWRSSPSNTTAATR